jgi:hypothetical protein
MSTQVPQKKSCKLYACHLLALLGRHKWEEPGHHYNLAAIPVSQSDERDQLKHILAQSSYFAAV